MILFVGSRVKFKSRSILFRHTVITIQKNRLTVFNNYRDGKRNNIFNERLHDEDKITFIDWLTNVDETSRPECTEILEHAFLQDSRTNIDNRTIPAHHLVQKKRYKLSDEYIDFQRRVRENLGEYKSEFLEMFEPQEILGSGAFGIVIKARNMLDETIYAVKIIPTSEGYREINLNEVRAFASLSHKRIVSYKRCWFETPPNGWQNKCLKYMMKMFQAKADTRQHYLDDMMFHNYPRDECIFIYCQMELCMGTLAGSLEDDRSRDMDRAKHWFRQIVSGVEFIHKNNKIHRDLKPSNILIDKDGNMKVGDLGILTAQVLPDQEIDENGDPFRTNIGTKMYMAPEQEGLLGYSHKVDIFALGLIFIELCIFQTNSENFEMFERYRRAEQCTELDHLPEVKEFVAWLTNFNPNERPECEQILEHPFLSVAEQN